MRLIRWTTWPVVVLLVGLGLLLFQGAPERPAAAWEARAQPQAPQADYGDAPDGQPCGYDPDPASDITCRFPTRFATANARVPGRPGAHALNVSGESLGGLGLTSLERDADDPADPDQTPNLVDDDVDDGLRVALLSSGAVRFAVEVRVAADAAPGTRYLNALYDRNRDGEWRVSDAGDEWVVQNLAVDVPPGGATEVELPLPVGSEWVEALADPAWLRVAFTRERIDPIAFAGFGGWDGSGAFAAGEIEDYKVGAARAYDAAWASRSAYRIAWAAARAQAEALALAYDEAQARALAIARVEETALALADAAAQARARAQADATAAAAALQQAEVQADATADAFALLPCAVVRASAQASVGAAIEMAGRAHAGASAAAEAAASARARAAAWARVVGEAGAAAQAAASALSAAAAQAEARAEALALSWASAQGWATALAQSVGSGALPAQASAYAFAWVQAQAWAVAWADAQASASAWALAVSDAEASAAAFARAEAAAQAVADAQAAAEAAATAVASAGASVASAASVISGVASSVEVETLGDCCSGGGFCPLSAPSGGALPLAFGELDLRLVNVRLEDDPRDQKERRRLYDVELVGFEIENEGDGPAGPVKVTWAGAGLVGSAELPSLPAGEPFFVEIDRVVEIEEGDLFPLTVRLEPAEGGEGVTQVYLIECERVGSSDRCSAR